MPENSINLSWIYQPLIYSNNMHISFKFVDAHSDNTKWKWEAHYSHFESIDLLYIAFICHFIQIFVFRYAFHRMNFSCILHSIDSQPR